VSRALQLPFSRARSEVSSASRNGSDSRKQAISIRMSRSDVRHIKRLAERLGARDSDVIRFAIKVMLSKLAPLQDLSVRGSSLVPVFLESGPELMRHFDLDAVRLAGIFNDGVSEERCIDPDDIQLIAMSGIQRSFVKLRVERLRRAQGPDAPAAHDHGTANGKCYVNGEDDPLDHSLRQYLYEKYLFSKSSA
jgi:Arc/MetJ-type ribon-helix-helix transcriptional regulator